MATKINSYDGETGQMYAESAVSVRSRGHSNWIGELKTPGSAIKPRPNLGPGVRSLADMVVNRLALNFRDLTCDHFEAIPWPLANRIWETVLSHHRESFHSWRILATVYPRSMATAKYHYDLSLNETSLPFVDYLGGLTSKPARWLTCLRISPRRTRPADLIQISKISNLAILDLSDGCKFVETQSSPLDERVFRAWAEVAASGQAFSRLQVLMIGWQENIDRWLFKYLTCFPALQKLILTDCAKLDQRNRKMWEPDAFEVGWEARHGKRSARSLRPVLSDTGGGTSSGLNVKGLLFEDDWSEKTGPPLLPILEVWMNGPMGWTHILEDFPGTRTIYFDRKTVVTRIPPIVSIALERRGHEATKRGRPTQSPPKSTPSPPSKRAPQKGLKPRKSKPRHTNQHDFSDIFGQGSKQPPTQLRKV